MMKSKDKAERSLTNVKARLTKTFLVELLEWLIAERKA